MLKFDAARIHFLSEVFVAVAIVVAYYKCSIMGSTPGFLDIRVDDFPPSPALSFCPISNEQPALYL